MQIVVGNVVGLEGVEPSIVLSGLSGAHLPILLQARWCPRQDLNLHALRHPLLRRARLPFRHGDKLWLVSRDLNSDAPREHSVLQTGATNRIRLTPKLWRKRRDSNSQACYGRHVSSVLGYHYPTLPNWHRYDDSNAVLWAWNPNALPGAHRCKLYYRGGKRRNRTLNVQHVGAVFETVSPPWRPPPACQITCGGPGEI